MVLALRRAQLASPVDGVITSVNDADAWIADTNNARRLGFGGKLCMHPNQVAGVNGGFAPSEAELAWVNRVMEAEAAAGGGPTVWMEKWLIHPSRHWLGSF